MPMISAPIAPPWPPSVRSRRTHSSQLQEPLRLGSRLKLALAALVACTAAVAEEDSSGRTASPYPPLSVTRIVQAESVGPAIPTPLSTQEIWDNARSETDAATPAISTAVFPWRRDDPFGSRARTGQPNNPLQVSSLLVSHQRLPRKQSAGSQASRAILQRFPFVPINGLNADLPDPSSGDNGVVVLPELTVVGRPPPGIDQAVEETQRASRTELFTWKDGGTIFKYKGKRVTVVLRTNLFGFLSVSW